MKKKTPLELMNDQDALQRAAYNEVLMKAGINAPDSSAEVYFTTDGTRMSRVDFLEYCRAEYARTQAVTIRQLAEARLKQERDRRIQLAREASEEERKVAEMATRNRSERYDWEQDDRQAEIARQMNIQPEVWNQEQQPYFRWSESSSGRQWDSIEDLRRMQRQAYLQRSVEAMAAGCDTDPLPEKRKAPPKVDPVKVKRQFFFDDDEK